MKSQLTPQSMELLREVVEKQRPDLLSAVAKAQSSSLTDDERTAFLDAISSEFCASGLRSDDEPNQRGLLLEALLDDLNRNHIKPR